MDAGTISVREAAALLGVSTSAVRADVKAGRLSLVGVVPNQRGRAPFLLNRAEVLALAAAGRPARGRPFGSLGKKPNKKKMKR